MSQPQYGGDMDWPTPPVGPMRRAGERTAEGRYANPLPRPQYPSPLASDASPKGNLSPPPRRHLMTSPQPPTQPPSKPPPPTPNSPGPASPAPSRQRMPVGVPMDERGVRNISRPTHMSQWPLPPGSPLRPANQEPPRASPGRPLQPPPRPARPSRIPSMVNQHRPQEPTPVFRYHREEPEEQVSPVEDHSAVQIPVSPSSRYTVSSVGTIPEFPAPGAPSGLSPSQPMAPPSRRSVVLGPPPSSRRGVSSYYSTLSNVSPIPEESGRSHRSYASSAAMPGNWSPNSAVTASPNYTDNFSDDSTTEKSRESPTDDFGDESKLVRSASIGKKGKAALVDNRPSVSHTQTRPAPQPIQRPFGGGTAYVEVSTSSSNTVPTNKQEPGGDDQRGQQFLVPLGIQEGLVKDVQEPRLSPPNRSNSRLSTIKRPPRLDMEAVRSAEARGSITSLPDLIKRATRLAAMIDVGKRPASRFDTLEDFLDKPSNQGADGSSGGRHHSGLSDMLAAFPSPAQATPREQKNRGSWFPTTSWPLAPSRLRSAERLADPPTGTEKAPPAERRQRRRRCCGMPPWAFVLVVLLIVAAIAVAIVIPLQFFVFKTLGNHPDPLSAIEQCQESLTCQNGGTNVITQGSCSCICTNGFTGRDCSVGGSEGCTTTDLSPSGSSPGVRNVTIGNAIPRLINGSQTNFSIPLSGADLLSKINSGDLSCRAQNSLVTFGGRSMRTKEALSDVSGLMNEQNSVAADDGAATEPNSDPTNEFTTTEEILDFARVAVLYILQEETTDIASTAQANLEQFFSTATRDGGYVTTKQATNITLGGGNSIDLVDLRVNVGDGAIGGEA